MGLKADVIANKGKIVSSRNKFLKPRKNEVKK